MTGPCWTDTKNGIEVAEKIIGSFSVDRLTLLFTMPDSETVSGVSENIKILISRQET
jgi:hypothetical protein